MSYKKRLAKDLSFLLSEKFLTVVLGFLRVYFGFRLLGAAGFGQVGLLESAFSLATSLATFRTTESLTRSLIDFRTTGASVVNLVRVSLSIEMAAKWLAAAFVFVAFLSFSSYFANHAVSLELLLLVFISDILVFPSDTFFALVRERRDFRYLTVSSISSKVLFTVLLIALYLLEQKSIRLFMWALIASRLMQFVLQARYVRDFVRRDTSRSIRNRDAIKAFANPFRYWSSESYAGYWYYLKMGFWTSTASALIKNGADTLILGYIGKTEDIGFYRLAKSLAEKVLLIPQVLTPYFFQDFSEWIAYKRFERMRAFLRKFVLLWTPFIVAVCGVAILTSQPLILYFFGLETMPAVNHFRILMTGITIQVTLFWVHPLLMGMKLLRAQLLGAVLVTIGFFAIFLVCRQAMGVYSISAALAAAWGGGCLYLAAAVYFNRALLMADLVEVDPAEAEEAPLGVSSGT